MTETVKDEILRAIQTLGLTKDTIRLLPEEQGKAIFEAALAQFVRSGDRKWWWEDFRLPARGVTFDDQMAFTRLTCIVPSPTEKVWFIVEEDRLPFYPVYEASTEVVQAVIGECYGYEYYVMDKGMTWLVCETHHDVLYVIGQELEPRLLACAA